MKHILLNIIFLGISINLSAQTISIPGTNLQFELPSKEWSLRDTQSTETMDIYFYKREAIIDSKGRQVIPNISIISESNGGLDVVTYSAMKRTQMPPFDVLEVFTPAERNMKYKNGIGYKGNYTDKNGPHTVYVMFYNDADVGVRVICDATSELFDRVEAEFTAALSSIQRIE